MKNLKCGAAGTEIVAKTIEKKNVKLWVGLPKLLFFFYR